jgi:glycosyltransferase involved in cell wall biosynthesis
MPTNISGHFCVEFLGVVTGRGERERYVRELAGGIVADPDPESVANAVTRLLEALGSRATLGRQGYEYVRQRYDRTAIAAWCSVHLHGWVNRLTQTTEDLKSRSVAE